MLGSNPAPDGLPRLERLQCTAPDSFLGSKIRGLLLPALFAELISCDLPIGSIYCATSTRGSEKNRFWKKEVRIPHGILSYFALQFYRRYARLGFR